MNRSPDQSSEDPRLLWPLVRLFGILADIAAQKDATGQGIEAATPLRPRVDLVSDDSSTPTDSVADRIHKEAA
jgi:hypothetical protein